MTEANQKEPEPNVAGGRRGGGQNAGVSKDVKPSVCLSVSFRAAAYAPL